MVAVVVGVSVRVAVSVAVSVGVAVGVVVTENAIKTGVGASGNWSPAFPKN